MSALVVSNTHIATLCNFAQSKGVSVYHANRRWDCRNVEDLDTLGQILVNQNYLSVNHRYKEEGEPFEYKAQRTMPVSPVAILKACSCYDYQACETDDYETTLAHDFVSAIRSYAIHALPGYDEAPWSIENKRYAA